MKPEEIKTLDIHGKEWFDRINGNSYHSVRVVINYGMPTQKTLAASFRYGYGNSYEQTAGELLGDEVGAEDHIYPLWSWCNDRRIVLRSEIQRKCLKREVVAHGKP